jgi:hypothetical protein
MDSSQTSKGDHAYIAPRFNLGLYDQGQNQNLNLGVGCQFNEISNTE